MNTRLPQTGRLFQRGRLWWCRFKFQGRGYDRSMGTPNRFKAMAESEALMEQVRVSIRKGTFSTEFGNGDEKILAVSKGEGIPLGSIWQAYLASDSRPRRTAQSTLAQYVFQMAAFLQFLQAKHPAVTTMDEITKEIAKEFPLYLEKERHLNTTTLAKYVRFMRLLWKVLMPDKANPWLAVDATGCESNTRKDFTTDEIHHIVRNAVGWMRGAFVVGAYLGQRLGDSCLLRWEKVDFGLKVVRMTPRKTRRHKNLRDMELPLHPVLYGWLARLHQEQGKPVSGYVNPEAAQRYLDNPTHLSKTIGKFLKKIGFKVNIEGVKGGKAVAVYGFHSLRHSYCTFLRHHNAPDAVMKELVGGSFEHYTHGNIASKRIAVDTLPDFIGETTEPASVPTVPAPLEGMSDAKIEATLVELEAELSRRREVPQRKVG